MTTKTSRGLRPLKNYFFFGFPNRYFIKKAKFITFEFHFARGFCYINYVYLTLIVVLKFDYDLCDNYCDLMYIALVWTWTNIYLSI